MTVVGNEGLLQETKADKKVPVIEIFGPTIQGEGPLAGSKTMFVRFGGCDFRCKMCDSMHAVNPRAVKHHAKRMTQQEIADELIGIAHKTGTEWVVFSGGNPCMWDLSELVELLHKTGIAVSVETQGTLAPDWLLKTNLVVISPKGPGMGEDFKQDVFEAFVGKLTGRVMMALKVVVFAQADFDFGLAVGRIAYDMGAIPTGMRFFSLGNPLPPQLNGEYQLVENPQLQREGTSHINALMHEYRQLVEDMCNDPRISDWKFLPQLHVLIWGNESER